MTSVTRYPSYVKKKSEPLIRDLFLEPASTSSMSAQLTTDFIKFLCFQKGQIPVTCSQMESHLCTTVKEFDKKMDFSCMKSRERMAIMKQRRSKENFIKKTSQFVKDINDVCSIVTNSFLVGQKQVAVIVGSSIFNPKEVYILDFTHWKDSIHDSGIEETKNLKRNISSFFRDLVISEDLFSFLQPVRPTGVSVLLNCQSQAPLQDENCLPRLNYRIPARGKQMVLRIFPKTSIKSLIPLSTTNYSYLTGTSSDTVSRRLIFNSPRPVHAKNFKDHEGLDISGIGQLDEDLEPREDSLVEPIPEEFCWFQIRRVLRGFVCQM